MSFMHFVGSVALSEYFVLSQRLLRRIQVVYGQELEIVCILGVYRWTDVVTTRKSHECCGCLWMKNNKTWKCYTDLLQLTCHWLAGCKLVVSFQLLISVQKLWLHLHMYVFIVSEHIVCLCVSVCVCVFSWD